MRQLLQALATIFGIVVIIVGAYMFIEQRYALKDQLQNIKVRLDMKIISDQILHTQSRIWKLKDRVDKRKQELKDRDRRAQDVKGKGGPEELRRFKEDTEQLRRHHEEDKEELRRLEEDKKQSEKKLDSLRPHFKP